MISSGQYLEHIIGTSAFNSENIRELIDQQQWGVFNMSGSFQKEWFLFFFFFFIRFMLGYCFSMRTVKSVVGIIC